MSQRKAAKHKHTVYCTVNGCKYKQLLMRT